MVYLPSGPVRTEFVFCLKVIILNEKLPLIRKIETQAYFFMFNCSTAETEKGIFDAILQGHIDFESAPWPSISSSAKDLVRKMLTQEPQKRITSAQVLGISLSIIDHWVMTT